MGYNAYSAFADEPVITSSSFTYIDPKTNVNYPLSYIRDDNIGNLAVYTDINGVFTILNGNLGTIDYTTGTVSISTFAASYYDTYISIYMLSLIHISEPTRPY